MKDQMWWMDFNLYTLNIPTPFLHAKRDLNTIDEISIYSSNVGNEIWQTYKLYHYDASKKASLHCKFASTHHFRHTSFLRQLNISINFCFVYLYCAVKFFSRYLMLIQILRRNVLFVHSIFLSRSFCYGTILLLTANWQLFFILTFWMSTLMIFRPSSIIASFNVFWNRINVTKNRNYLTFKSVLTPQRIEYH